MKSKFALGFSPTGAIKEMSNFRAGNFVPFFSNGVRKKLVQ